MSWCNSWKISFWNDLGNISWMNSPLLRCNSPSFPMNNLFHSRMSARFAGVSLFWWHWWYDGLWPDNLYCTTVEIARSRSWAISKDFIFKGSLGFWCRNSSSGCTFNECAVTAEIHGMLNWTWAFTLLTAALMVLSDALQVHKDMYFSMSSSKRDRTSASTFTLPGLYLMSKLKSVSLATQRCPVAFRHAVLKIYFKGLLSV